MLFQKILFCGASSINFICRFFAISGFLYSTKGTIYENVKKKIIKMLKLNAKTGFTYRILKKSLDARKKPELFYTYSVAVEIEDTKNSEEAIVKRAASSSVLIYKEKEYMIPACGHIPLDRRPVIAGAGPAGLFCAYILAEAGFRPIVIERGSRVEKRT